MEDLAVITAQNHKGSFGKYFVEFKRKKKTVIHKLMSGKTVHSVFSTGNQDLGHTYFDALCLKEHGFTH